jgi:uncharacterized protein YyaL (SSP411 family)
MTSMPNRLAFEKSPYLLQHASNPVDWMPWGDEAFAKAKAEDKLMLVSIGYSTCHWCHVMEHECFAVPEVAALMNQWLVCVKVDREERPDVDRVYMNAVMALTGQGGWPLNCFITPEGKPVFGGTYFPPQPAYGRPSWPQLVAGIGAAWKDPAHRLKMLQDAESLTAALKRLEGPAEPGDGPVDPAGGPLTAAPLEALYRQLKASYDAEQGGFTDAPKFPMPGYQRILFRLARRFKLEGHDEPAADAGQMALETLRQMARGGIYDHLGGGFARYSTDAHWHLPHFEKMLYDNAQLAMNYTEAYKLSGDARFAEVVRGIVGYVLRDLGAPEGAFYSAEDADSTPAAGGPKKEGAFYAWSKAEIEAALGPPLTDLFCAAYGVEADGNVRHDPHQEFTGLNVLYDRRGTVAALVGGAAELSKEAFDAKLAQARQALFARRQARPRPHRDEKILAGWNGLMIAALAQAGRALAEPAWVAAAEAAAGFFLRAMWEPATGTLWRRFAGGERAVQGQADDYAFLAWGLLELHQATLDPKWLQACGALVKAARPRFFDPADGQVFNGGIAGDPRLPVRVKDVHDNVEPAPASVFVELQLRLWLLTGDQAWRADAERTLAGCQASLERSPRALVHLAGALDRWLQGGAHAVICAQPGDPAVAALRQALERGLHPHLDLSLVAPGQPVAGAPQGYALKDGRAAAYVCRGFSCQPPVSDPADLSRMVEAL